MYFMPQHQICRSVALLCHISSAQILLRAKHTQNKSPLRAAEAPCFGWCTSGAVFFCLLCSGWFAPVRFSFCFSVASRSSYDATCTSTQLLATETKSIELSSAAAADLVSTSSWSSYVKPCLFIYNEAFSLGNKALLFPLPHILPGLGRPALVARVQFADALAAGAALPFAAQRRSRQAPGAHQRRQNARPVYLVPGYCLD